MLKFTRVIDWQISLFIAFMLSRFVLKQQLDNMFLTISCRPMNRHKLSKNVRRKRVGAVLQKVLDTLILVLFVSFSIAVVYAS